MEKETSTGTFSAENQEGKKSKKGSLKALKVILSILLVLEMLYCAVIFVDLPYVSRLRDMYIQTAMSTMSHRWLAQYFIPKDVIDRVMDGVNEGLEHQMGLNSTWEDAPTKPTIPPTDGLEASEATIKEHVATEDEIAFFELFHEIDRASMLDYVEKNPSVIANGWDHIYINEAGLNDKGTSIKTTEDDQVLAIDAQNQVVLIRVTGSSYRGVLAVAKDPSRLKLGVSKNIGSYGQKVGEIGERYDGVLAITASGFDDPNGGGNGGTIAGACMSEGKTYGKHFTWGYKRIELHEDNRLYITNAQNSYMDGCTDACEFKPALVVDGKNALGSDNIFIDMNPRCCIGQTAEGEILMLVIEGRFLDSLGTDAEECTNILLRYNAYQALNMDGGTSAIMWFDGEYVTRCSNTKLDAGRYVPNAWVY